MAGWVSADGMHGGSDTRDGDDDDMSTDKERIDEIMETMLELTMGMHDRMIEWLLDVL